MKFTVGYQINDGFVSEIVNQRENISEVYFSFGDFPSGRNAQTVNETLLPFEAQAKQLEHLKIFKENGIELNLLFNANCYGKESLSRCLYNRIGDTVDYIINNYTLKSITTTSPLIAKFIKENFPGIKTRASVNMKIGTIQGMDYLSKYFDSYYIQREYNRDFNKIKELKAWSDANGKTLYILANSGCLNHCSAQTFHDNLVAHEAEIAQMDNAYVFHGLCKDYLSDPVHYESLIKDTNFIRPEDIHLYEGLFEAAKLATRVSKNPIRTLRAYVNARYSGNLLDVLEPAHNIYPYVLENGSPLKIVKINTDMAIYDYEKDNKKEEKNDADK